MSLINIEYSWLILAVMICGFILVSGITQVLNRNPAE
ncbi:MAG: hypothetical protein PWQ15_1286 [Methanobacterium sp.]|nr:hypothetical protein [Methanobacterium sp.]